MRPERAVLGTQGCLELVEDKAPDQGTDYPGKAGKGATTVAGVFCWYEWVLRSLVKCREAQKNKNKKECGQSCCCDESVEEKVGCRTRSLGWGGGCFRAIVSTMLVVPKAGEACRGSGWFGLKRE